MHDKVTEKVRQMIDAVWIFRLCYEKNKNQYQKRKNFWNTCAKRCSIFLKGKYFFFWNVDSIKYPNSSISYQ